MEALLKDVRQSVRVLLKSPGFSSVAILALALGIGANAAIFSVIDRVLLRPLPFPDSERMMRIERHFPEGNGGSVSIPKYMAWRQAQSFQSITAYDFGAVSMNLGTSDRPDPINATHVSAGFFDVFGVRPILGRTFSTEEDLPNGGKFAVLTYRAWKNRLGADRDIIGRPITLNSEHYVVIGVLQEGFEPDPPTDIYLPEQFDPNSTNQGHIYVVTGRLKPTATIASAEAELKVIGDRFRVAYPDAMDKTESIAVVPLRVAIGGDIRPALVILAGAVGFVLLIACANVANLLLARASGRQREIAIRTAVGASRGRIVRQLLTESIILAMAGGAAGLLLGTAGVHLLLTFSPGNIPRINDPDHAVSALAWLDWRMVGFLAGISLLTGLLFGILPALSASRFDVHSALKESSGRSGTGIKHNRIRSALVVAEVALAVILLAGAALMIRTFAGLRAVDPGFNPTNVLTLKTGGTYTTTAQAESIIRQARERIEALPGVDSVGCALLLPVSGEIDMPFSIEGRTPKEGKYEGDEQWRFVSSGYFQALGIPLVRGRLLDQRDTGKSDRVVVINEAMAKKYWPKQDALGQRMLIAHGLGADFEEPPREVVGVVGSVTEIGLGNGKVPVMYVPQSQITDGLTKLGSGLLPLSWVIRTKADPLSIAAPVSRELQTLNTQLAPTKVLPMQKVIAESTTRDNFNVLLLSVFALVALSLAAVGIYGLMSYAVQQRTQEIGIRMALGADRGRVLKLILSQSLLLTGIGTIIGVAAAFFLTRLLAAFLFGVKSSDPLSYSLVVLTLVGVAVLAAWVPAQRAMRVDPLRALRQE